MSKYKTFKVADIHNLFLAALVGWIMVACMAVGFINYVINKNKEISQIIEKHKADNSEENIKKRIDALLEERKLSQLRQLIRDNNKNLSVTDAARLASYEVKYAKLNNIKLEDGVAVSLTESTFKPKASTWCCIGIKGLNFYAHQYEYNFKSKEQLYDMEFNVKKGYEMLANHVERYGSIERALQRYYGSTVPRENVEYSQKVMQRSRYIERKLS